MRRVRPCTKVTYRSLEMARRACQRVWITAWKKNWPYKCPFCRKWHLTSLPVEKQIERGLKVFWV